MRCTNPIIIGGAGSSGSTLLVSILNRSKEIAAGPELSLLNKKYFFETPFSEIQKLKKHILKRGKCTDGWFIYPRFFFSKYGFTDEEMDKMFSDAANQLEFIDLFFKNYLQKEDKKIWAEKTPSNSYCFTQLEALYPEARFIHIYRDGRDVVTSFIKRGMSPYFATMLWIYNTAHALRFRGRSNYYELRYEELVYNPSKEVKKLCEFLDIPYNERLLRPDDEKKLEVDSWNHSPNQGIDSSSVGKYASYLESFHYYCMKRSQISNKHKTVYGLQHGSFHEVQEALGYEGIADTGLRSFPGSFIFGIRLLYLVVRDVLYRYYMLAKTRSVFPPYPGRIILNKRKVVQ